MINRILTPPEVIPILILQQGEADKYPSLRKIRTDNNATVEIRIPFDCIPELVDLLNIAYEEYKKL